MNTVIIICNDPRIALVKETIQPLLIAKIGIVTDFDTGLKEVFEKRPLVVFIQNEIAEVRGETVARHIKSLLQANSPQLIPLDHASAGPGMINDLSDGINLNLPDEELVAEFRAHLEKIPGICWKKQAAKPTESGPPIHSPQDAVHVDEAFSFFTPHKDDAPPLPVVERFTFDIAEKPSAVPPPVVPETAVDRAKAGIIPGEANPEFSRFAEGVPPSPPAPSPPSAMPVASRPEPSPVRRPEPAPDTARIDRAGSEEVPFPAEPAPARRSKLPLLIGGGVLAALMCGVVLYLLFPAEPKPQSSSTISPKQPIPVAAPPKPAPVGAKLREKLPSFIPKEGLDPAYGAARPGWERYVSPRREYLVFRENGTIRALQVIALHREAIDAPFVSSVLRELCGEATCSIRSRSSRDGYLIEQGQTSTKAEVIFYKKKGTGETRGVVISLP